jgi:hypothetical protein
MKEKRESGFFVFRKASKKGKTETKVKRKQEQRQKS